MGKEKSVWEKLRDLEMFILAMAGIRMPILPFGGKEERQVMPFLTTVSRKDGETTVSAIASSAVAHMHLFNGWYVHGIRDYEWLGRDGVPSDWEEYEAGDYLPPSFADELSEAGFGPLFYRSPGAFSMSITKTLRGREGHLFMEAIINEIASIGLDRSAESIFGICRILSSEGYTLILDYDDAFGQAVIYANVAIERDDDLYGRGAVINCHELYKLCNYLENIDYYGRAGHIARQVFAHSDQMMDEADVSRAAREMIRVIADSLGIWRK